MGNLVYWLVRSLILFTEPVVLVGALEGSFLASFGLGWGVTIGAGLASYPLDTIRYVIGTEWIIEFCSIFY